MKTRNSIRLVLCLLFAGITTWAFPNTHGLHGEDSGEGVRFERALDWSGLKAKAATEGKMLMVECYTTWCAPCKHLDAHVFPVKEVGDFFNRHFVSFKIQMDRTEKDDDYTRSRYAMADSIQSAFEVNVYPTFLFFNQEGDLVHRITGAGDAIPDFLKRIGEALDPQKQYHTIMRNFERSPVNDIGQVKALAELALAKRDTDRQNSLSARFFDLLGTEIDTTSILFATKFNTSSDAPAFSWFIDWTGEIDALRHHGFSESQILRTLLKEEYYDSGMSRSSDIDWGYFRSEITARYPAYAESFTALCRVHHALMQDDPAGFIRHVQYYMKHFGHTANTESLHSFAWQVSRLLDPDLPLATEALEWMERVLADEDHYVHRQTQACLLYVIGRTEEAIAIQQKATAEVHEFRREPFLKKLKKMKAGEPLN